VTAQGKGAATARAGIIGCGVIADNHIRALRRLDGVEVVALVDRNQDVANTMAARHRIPSAYVELKAMLAEKRLDVLHITTPPRTHASVCEQALRSGCHVLIEKPAALSSNELDGMLGLAKANGLIISVVHNGIYQRAFRRALSTIKAGAIGELRSVQIIDHIPSEHDIVSNPAHWSHALAGGVYGEVLPHDIYIADALVPGLKLDSVGTYGSGRHPWLPVEQVLASLSSGPVSVTINASVDGADWNKTIEITGTAGSVRVDRMCDIVTVNAPQTDWTLRTHVQRVTSHIGAWMQQSAETAAAKASRQALSGHDELIKRFYSAIRHRRTAPVSEEHMRRTTALYELLTAAIDSGVAA